MVKSSCGAGHKESEAIRKCQCQGLFEQISRFIVAVFWLCSKNKICFLLRFFGEKCCFFLLENTAQNVLAPKIFWCYRTRCPKPARMVLLIFLGWGSTVFLGAGRGHVENFTGRGRPEQPFSPGRGHSWYLSQLHNRRWCTFFEPVYFLA